MNKHFAVTQPMNHYLETVIPLSDLVEFAMFQKLINVIDLLS